MLKSFSVTGFKNFKDKITVDFSDVRDYNFNTECVREGLVNTAVIYGKNGTGKSNLGLALFDIVSNLTMKIFPHEFYDYFANVYCDSYVKFEYEFQFSDDELKYCYEKFKTYDTITAENLELNGKQLFNWKGEYEIVEGWGISPISKDDSISNISTDNIKGLLELAPTLNVDAISGIFDNNSSLLKYFLNNSMLDKAHPLSKLNNFVNNMLLFKGLSENEFIGYKEKNTDYYSFMFSGDGVGNGYIDEFNELLKQAEIDMRVRPVWNIDGETRLYFDTQKPMPFFKAASSGTKALYNFFYWYKTAPDVSFMYIDEFDAFYHFELAETIVKMLEKMTGFQKILTSHNTNLLTNRILRPDCYFILTQDKITSFVNATDMELRQGHNLEKLYMGGEFDG